MTVCKLKSKYLLIGLVLLLQSCAELMPGPNDRVRVLEDSMRLNSDSVIYRYTYVDGIGYICIGNNIKDVYDTNKVVAEQRVILLDSVRGNKIYVFSKSDLQFHRQPKDFIIITNKKFLADRQYHKYWYVVLKDSVTGNYYLKDP